MRPGVSRTPFRAVIRGIAPSRRPVPRRNAQDAGSGGAFTPSVEAGLRHDGGDADEGLDVEAGCGLDAWGGLLTPCAGLSVPEDVSSAYRLGERLSMSVEGGVRERENEGPVHGVALRGSLRW